MMKRNPKINKLMALILALVLFTSSSVGVYAEDDKQDNAVESQLTTGDGKQETPEKSEDITEPSSDSRETSSDETDDKTSDDITSKDKSVEDENTEDNEIEDKESEDKESEEKEPEEDSEKKDSSKEDETGGTAKDPDSNSKDSDEKNSENIDSDDKEKSEDDEKKEKSETEDETDKIDSKHSDDHELVYKDLGNGKHMVSCKEECKDFESYEEDCTYDEDGICKKCRSYDESKDKNKQKSTKQTQSAELNGVTVEAEFTEDTFAYDDVKLVVTAVSDDITEMVEASIRDTDFICNYKMAGVDISFMSGDKKVQPKKEQNVKITIKGLKFKPKTVGHLDEQNEYTEISFNINEDGSITFATSSFSPFILVTFDEKSMDKVTSDERLYGCPKESIGTEGAPKQSAYGYAATTVKHLEGIYAKEDIDDGYYALRMVSHNSDDNNYVTIAPYEGNKERYYAFEPVENGEFIINIEAPENYYIESVYLKGSEDKFYKYEGGTYETSLKELPITLKKMDSEKTVNDLIVCLKQIPIKLINDDTTTVKGVKIINYQDSEFKGEKSYLRAFGDSFYFNHGDESRSNRCNYRQVYQGLGSETFDVGEGFKLVSDNGVRLFPDSGDHDYIVAGNGYHENVEAVFTKDENGYWTIDSDSTRYELVTEGDKDLLKPVSGEKSFRPFGGHVNHFGMELPIEFSINNDGKDENGNDTIFKFAGDDDVFVYIDNKLVLDLGGVHDAIRGQINFRTGEVLIQGDHESKLTSSVDNTCYAKEGIGSKNLYTIFDKSAFMNKEHKLTVVYFERGASLSNCRISFNFYKTEQVDTEFKGFKRKADGQTPVAGAEFTLYTDEACKENAKIGVSDAVATSDAEGTILFKGLPVGVIANNSTKPVKKSYYMKETKAAKGFVTPSNAVWKLELEAQKDGAEIKTSYTLTPQTDEAKELTVKPTGSTDGVVAIKNDDAKIVTGDYEGLKVDATDNTKKLKDAEFTLYKTYKDGACQDEVKKVTTDNDGKFDFTEIEVGTFESTAQEKVEKIYYLKETKAPKGYVLRENAVWALTFTANKGDAKATGKLTALTEDAKAISILMKEESDEVKAITNNEKAPGKLKITKIVKNFYKPGGVGACVFQVDYTVDDKLYSYVYSLDFTKAGVKSLKEIEIPADAEVTVTEKYSGACYSIVGSNKKTVTIEENKTATVEFENDYDGRKNVGGISVKNVFTKKAEKVYEFLKMVMGGEQ